MGLLVSNPSNPCSCAGGGNGGGGGSLTGQSQQISPGTGQAAVITNPNPPPTYNQTLTFNYLRVSGPSADSNYRYYLDLLATPADPTIRPAIYGHSFRQNGSAYIYTSAMKLELDIIINGTNIYTFSGSGSPWPNRAGFFYLILAGWDSSDPNYDEYRTNSTPLLTTSDQLQVLCTMSNIVYDMDSGKLWRDQWSPATHYNAYDMVRSNAGHTYFASIANVNQDPDYSSNYWQKMYDFENDVLDGISLTNSVIAA